MTPRVRATNRDSQEADRAMAMKLQCAILLLAALALPAMATDVFRCATDSGGIEYRDWPCTAGTGDKLLIEDSTVDPAATERALFDIREQSRALDDRINARVLAERQARAAEARYTYDQQLLADAPPPEPDYVYGGSIATDRCLDRRSACVPHRRPPHEPTRHVPAPIKRPNAAQLPSPYQPVAYQPPHRP